MDPSPIPTATVSRLLELIVDLSEPLPPYLLSPPLRQRQHFLDIAFDDPAQYLAWPGSGGADSVKALQAFRTAGLPPEHLDFTAKYSAEPGEFLEAHVHVPITNAEDASSGFRLIFRWYRDDGWLYHNLAPMPFPQNSYSSFPNALGIFESSSDFLPEPHYVVSIAGDDDDDSYWNSYGDDDDTEQASKSIAKPHTPLNSEDAYWARYSSIQGSADSTIPSPLPVKSTFDPETKDPSDRVIVPSTTLRPTQPELYNPLQPPSPSSLSRRLAELSQRPASPPIEDEDDSTDSNPASPRLQLCVPDLAVLEATPDHSPTETTSSQEQDIAEADLALQQTIQGLFRLWKSERQQHGSPTNVESFVSIVNAALSSQL